MMPRIPTGLDSESRLGALCDLTDSLCYQRSIWTFVIDERMSQRL